MDHENSIVLEHVSCGYRGKMVLKDVSQTIPSGKKVMILGENGSGKTTLLKAMAGLLPYDGSIKVDGGEVKKMSSVERAGKISLLSQMNRAYFSYTVEETVLMGRYRFHKGLFEGVNKEDHEKAEEYMRRTDIYDIRNERIGELSGGQLQRVYLSQMYAQESKYVFLDEPTNHLDLKYRVALEKELKGSGHGVVAVYHDLAPAFRLADEIVLIKEGRVIHTGTPKEIWESKAINDAFDMDVISYLSADFAELPVKTDSLDADGSV